MVADFLADSTPDYSYLGLTPKATQRVAKGFEFFKGEVDKQISRLVPLARAAGMGDFPRARGGGVVA